MLSLADALKKKGVTVWLDLDDLRPAVRWQDAINKGIDAADNFIVVLSAHWVASNPCREELQQAIAGGKRLVPVKLDATPAADIGDPLKSYNFIFFNPAPDSDLTDFNAKLALLLDALIADLDWIGKHTWLLQRAVDWQDHGRDPNRLLLGDDLHDAELWQTKGPANGQAQSVQPTPLQLDYILESRTAATRRQKRSVRIAAAVSVVSLGLAAAAVLFAIRAVRQTHISDSGRLATAALLEKDAHFDLALLLSVEAHRSADTYEARNAQVTLAQSWPNLLRYSPSAAEAPANPDDSEPLATSPDGQSRAAYGSHGLVLQQLSGSESSRKWDDRPLPFAPEKGFGATTFSPEGQYLVSSGENGLQIWQIPSLRPVFRPDGTFPQRFTTAAVDAQVAFDFDPAQSNSLVIVDRQNHASYIPVDSSLPPSVNSPSFTQPGIGTDAQNQRAQLITSLIAKRTRLYPHSPSDEGISRIVFSPSGRRLAIAEAGSFWVADLDSQTVNGPFDTSRLPSETACKCKLRVTVAFSPDERWLAANNNGVHFAVWSVENVSTELSLLRQIDFQPSGFRWLPDNSLETWYPETRPANERFFRSDLGDGRSRIWLVGSQRGERILDSPRSSSGYSQIQNLAFTRDASTLISSDMNRFGIWNLTTGIESPRLVPWLSSPPVSGLDSLTGYSQLDGLRLSPEGDQIAQPAFDASPNDHLVRVHRWDIARSVALPDLTDPIRPNLPRPAAAPPKADVLSQSASAIGPSGLIAAASPLGIRVWTPDQPNRARWLRPDTPEDSTGLAFSPDGKLLASVTPSRDASNRDCMVRVWSVPRGRQLRSWVFDPLLDPIRKITSCSFPRLAFSPDSSLLALGSSAGMIAGFYLWNVRSGLPVMDFAQEISAFAFTPYGRQLVLRDKQFATMLWDLDAKRILGASMRPYILNVQAFDNSNGLAIAPDGRLIATGYDRGQLRLWQNPLGEDWQSTACTIAGRNMTLTEWQLYFGSAPYRKSCPNLP